MQLSGATATRYRTGRLVSRLHSSSCSSARSVAAQAADADLPRDSSETQEALVQLLRSKISQTKAVEELGGVADAEKMKLIERADDVRVEIDKVSKLSRDRANLAFGSAQAHMNQQFNEMDAELKASRERMEAEQRDIDELEEKVMQDRQEGLLFKSLYANQDVEKRLRSKHMQPPPTIEAELQEQRLMQEQHGRSLRQYMFGSLAVISLAACVSDVLIGPAKTWQALLYAAIAISIAITVSAEQAASRDIQKELQRLRERNEHSQEQQ